MRKESAHGSAEQINQVVIIKPNFSNSSARTLSNLDSLTKQELPSFLLHMTASLLHTLFHTNKATCNIALYRIMARSCLFLLIRTLHIPMHCKKIFSAGPPTCPCSPNDSRTSLT